MAKLADLHGALDRQADTLVDLGFPALLGLSDQEFAARLDPLRSLLDQASEICLSGNIPLCLAFRPGLLNLADAMARIEAKGAKGIVDMTPLTPDAFGPIDGLRIPTTDFYLLIDVDTGRDFLNVSPEDSLRAMRERGRTPLSMEEGVALTVQHPALLTDKSKYNCIQMPGSRKSDDQRVPSIWFSRGAPRLGWCWDRNVHTWLGSASAKLRLGDLI